MTTDRKTLRSSRPNGHYLALVQFTGGHADDSVFVVVGPCADRDEDGDEFETKAEAEAHYDAEAIRLAATPNWAAQAAYDAEWGTDNGYAHQPVREY